MNGTADMYNIILLTYHLIYISKYCRLCRYINLSEYVGNFNIYTHISLSKSRISLTSYSIILYEERINICLLLCMIYSVIYAGIVIAKEVFVAHSKFSKCFA